MFKLLVWNVALLSEIAMTTDEGLMSESFVRGTTGSVRVVHVSHRRLLGLTMSEILRLFTP